MSNVKQEIRLYIRDIDHFYQIVRWMNKNVGRTTKTTKYWSMRGRVLRRVPTNADIIIYDNNFPEMEMLLRLL